MVSEFSTVHYDYSNTPEGEMSDPSNDTVELDEQGRWRIRYASGELSVLHFPTRELAVNSIRRREAIYEGDWERLDALWEQANELREQHYARPR